MHFPASREVWKAASGTRGGEVRPKRPRARPAGRAALDSPLSSPTALPAIFPLWLPSHSCNKSLLRQAPGGPGVAGMACVDQSLPSKCFQATNGSRFLIFLKSHSGEGQGTKWEGISKTPSRSPIGMNPPSGLPASEPIVCFAWRLHLDYGSLAAISKRKLWISQVSRLNFTRLVFHQSATRRLAPKCTC